MDEQTQAYLFRLGNPYAKLSVLDQEEVQGGGLSAVEPPRGKRSRSRSPDVNASTQAYLFKLEDPYAKLSFIEEAATPLTKLLWKTKTEIYHYVADSFALPQVLRRTPPLLKQFGAKVSGLSPNAQKALHGRLSAHIPDVNVAHNRLSPKELDQLLRTLLEMADDAAALDAKAG